MKYVRKSKCSLEHGNLCFVENNYVIVDIRILVIGIQKGLLSIPLQEEFVKLVKIQEESKEQVQYKCWAGWASEEKMRDALKIKELASYIFVYLSRKQLNMLINSGVIGI